MQGINKRLEFGLRTGTKDYRTGFYKGTDRAKAGTMVQDRPTRPVVDALTKTNSCKSSSLNLTNLE